MEKTIYTIEIGGDEEDREIALEQVFKQIKEEFTSGMDRAENGSYFQWSLTTVQEGEG